MTRVITLARRDLETGKTRKISYSQQRTLDKGQEKEISDILHAEARRDHLLQLIVVPSVVLARITGIACSAWAPGVLDDSPTVIKLTQNALARSRTGA
jgi:hypothetical protein